jgi:glycosyltransferase involved in cell wall biosynthesis
VYERVAVMQCLGLTHRRRRAALWVTESNGVFTRETAQDRRALGGTRLAARFERAAYRRSDLVVAVSRALADELHDFAEIPLDKVLVVPNAVPDHVLAHPRPPAPQTPILGFAGALVAWQSVDLLLRACGEPGVRNRVHVEILGDGTELEALRRLAAELGLDGSVTITGRLGPEATIARMSRWSAGYSGHAATSSTRMYHSPLKLYEYAGLGLDVVATRTDDAARLEASGVRVLYVAETTESAVTEAVRRLIALPRRSDAEIAALRGRVAEQHSWGDRVRSIDERLRELAE